MVMVAGSRTSTVACVSSSTSGPSTSNVPSWMSVGPTGVPVTTAVFVVVCDTVTVQVKIHVSGGPVSNRSCSPVSSSLRSSSPETYVTVGQVSSATRVLTSASGTLPVFVTVYV